jgi:hypothetical protein
MGHHHVLVIVLQRSWISITGVGFEFLIVLSMKVAIFWVGVLFSLVIMYEISKAVCALKIVADMLNSYQIYPIKCNIKFIWLILSFIFPCDHLETTIGLQELEIGPVLY